MSTYAKLDGHGEKIDASLLGDGITTINTGQVDVGGLNNALLTLQATEDLLGKAAFTS